MRRLGAGVAAWVTLLVAPRESAAQSPASATWSLEVMVGAGASAWSQPVLSSRLRGRPAGGFGLAVQRPVSRRWRAMVVADRYERGARGFSWDFRTRYAEVGALAAATLFDVGPVSLSLGGGPVIAWPFESRGTFSGNGPSSTITLDPSPQEYSSRFLLEARWRRVLPVSGRITFQRGLNRILRSNPLKAEGRWDGTTPPYSKLMAFELGATLLRW